MMIVTRDEAKMQGNNRFFDALPCKKGHISEKYVRDGYCCTCKTLNEQKHRDVRVKKAKVRYRRNKDSVIRKNKEYALRNKDTVKTQQLKWRSRNKERIKTYQKDNLWLYAYHAAKRRKLVKTATPKWVEHEEIKLIYAQCASIERLTGIKHHVDHIVPVNSKIVCGLHCPWNLRIITATENISKSNKLIDHGELPLRNLLLDSGRNHTSHRLNNPRIVPRLDVHDLKR